jgi:ADP-heptose:LPS heptosyltransferase
MKIDTMREIDQKVGVPLTFLMSIPFALGRLFLPKTRRPDVRRTLFIELSEMGSAVIVDPALRKLRDAGGATLFFAIFGSNRKSLEILNTVPPENVFAMRSENFWVLLLDVFRFIGWCRKHRITTVIDLELFSRFTALLTAVSGARSRIGFASVHDEGLYRGNFINFPVRYNAHVHVAVNFLSLVNTALGHHTGPYPTHAVAPEEVRLAKAPVAADQQAVVREKIRGLFPGYAGQKLFLLNVNASDLLPQRKWLPERFADIARLFLAEHPDWLVLATGAKSEYDYVQSVVSQVGHPHCLNTAGVFQFDELVPLYSLSTFMLTNDSGPAHFAAVTDLKVFVIFGPETPALYLPIGGHAEPIYLGLPCSPCVSAANHRKTTCQPRPCISGIPTALVKSRIDAFLRKKSPEAPSLEPA